MLFLGTWKVRCLRPGSVLKWHVVFSAAAGKDVLHPQAAVGSLLHLRNRTISASLRDRHACRNTGRSKAAEHMHVSFRTVLDVEGHSITG